MLAIGLLLPLISSVHGDETPAAGLQLHPKLAAIDLPGGPFFRLRSGEILAVSETMALVSSDEGQTWAKYSIFARGESFKIRPEHALLETRDGTIILAFLNDAERVWKWNKQTSDAETGTRLPTYVVRSRDGGRTWQDRQKLHDEWTGAIRSIIQTSRGAVVFTAMKLLHQPGRHASLTYSSQDDGLTWRASNLIDLGGKGHHDGGTEATLAELSDGRIWMLLRTNFGKFWQAFSTDQGVGWHGIGPSSIAASSAPGGLFRLKDGRLALLWNQLYPEGETTYPTVGGDGQWSQYPTINHREELSLAFSRDDGATWSNPVLLARSVVGRKDVSYPFLFEVGNGTFWVTTMRGGLSTVFRETDLSKE